MSQQHSALFVGGVLQSVGRIEGGILEVELKTLCFNSQVMETAKMPHH
jgi:hypothetical protein